MKKYDIAVLGGGFAGVGAAIAAAREGASVIIIEKGNCLGGAASHALVNPFMNFSMNVDGNKVLLADGIFAEIWNNIKATNAYRYSAFSDEELKFILNNMAEEAGVQLLFHSYLCGVDVENERVTAVSLATKNGIIKVEADYFIDATGDAQAAFLAGCPTRLGRDEDNLCQPMTLCFRLGNVDRQAFWNNKEALNEAYKKAKENGELSNPREDILSFRMPAEGVIHFNTTRVVKKNPVDVFEVTEAEIIARKQVHEMYDFLKKHAKGVENSFLMSTAAEIGVRESRMIVGDYRLTEEDCKKCVKFPDSVAACNYPIDIHNPEGTGTTLYHFPEGDYYTIPYRSLIPQGVNNMLVAGRCISSDHSAQASYRIMPTVCSIGQAAGTAAAIALKNSADFRSISVQELQAILKKNSAFTGI